MSGRLDGKVAVVTGAGRGVGRAYVHALVAEGASVVINDLPAHTSSPAEAVVAEVEAAGGRAVAVHESVTDFDGAKRIMDTAIEAFGRLDILVSNAGIIRPSFIADADESFWRDVLDVHANGSFNCIHHAAQLLIKQGGGTIIAAGDITQDVWFPKIVSYRAAKAAVAVLVANAAIELRDSNINVNSINPGPTDTQMSAAYFSALGEDLLPFMQNVQEFYATGNDDLTEAIPPDTVPPLGVYLCAAEGRGITGYSFQMSGRCIGVVSVPSDTRYMAPSGERWTTDELVARMPGFIEDRRPLTVA